MKTSKIFDIIIDICTYHVYTFYIEGMYKTYTIVNAVINSNPRFASGTLTTGKIDKWGHIQASLVLIMQGGKQVLITPEKYSVQDFYKTVTKHEKVDLKINARVIDKNTPFTIVSKGSNGNEELHCSIKEITY